MTTENIRVNRKTADRILDAADKLFGQLGYDGVSMNAVAMEAEVNKASVFYHYGNKDQLFERVLENYFAAHRSMLEATDYRIGSLRERFHLMVNAYLDFMVDNNRYPGLLQGLLHSSNNYISFMQRSIGPFIDWTKDALKDLDLEDGHLAPHHFYVTLSSAILNYFTYTPALEAFWDKAPQSPEALQERREHLHFVVDSLVDGLLNQQAIQKTMDGTQKPD